MTNNKVVNINTDLKGLMNYWLEFTKPFHKLRKQQQNILALLLYYYFLYKKDIKNDKMLWKIVFDYDTKLKIKNELNNLPDYTLQNNLTSLRKNGIIKNNKINKAYIPNLDLDSKSFMIIFKLNLIDLKNDKKR